MIQDNQPKVPNLPPLIANGDTNRGYYVCTYKNKWDSAKKRSVRVRSTSVGRVQGKDKFGLIEFYDEFVKQYPGLKRFQVYRTDGPQRLVFIPKPPRRKVAAKAASEAEAAPKQQKKAQVEADNRNLATKSESFENNMKLNIRNLPSSEIFDDSFD